MNKDYRGIIIQYSTVNEEAFKDLFEGKEDVSNTSLEGLTQITNASLVPEMYGYGLLLETNLGKVCVVSPKVCSEELISKVLEPEGVSLVKSSCYCYKTVSDETMNESKVKDMIPEEGDFFKDSEGNVYVVADISTRHVAMFDIKNKVKVISYGDIKNFTPITDGKEFNSLNKKFDRVTTGDKYLNYSLNESTQTSNVEAGNKVDYMEINDSDLAGKAFEFEDGIYVVTDVIDGTVYMIGPDDDMYQISLDDFENEVLGDIDEEFVNESSSDLKGMVTDTIIRKWLSGKGGINDKQFDAYANRIMKKLGCSFDDVYNEAMRQIDVLWSINEKDQNKWIKLKNDAESKKEIIFESVNEESVKDEYIPIIEKAAKGWKLVTAGVLDDVYMYLLGKGSLEFVVKVDVPEDEYEVFVEDYRDENDEYPEFEGKLRDLATGVSKMVKYLSK